MSPLQKVWIAVGITLAAITVCLAVGRYFYRRQLMQFSHPSAEEWGPPDPPEEVQALISMMPFRVEYDHYRECWFVMDRKDGDGVSVWVQVLPDASFAQWQQAFARAAEQSELALRAPWRIPCGHNIDGPSGP